MGVPRGVVALALALALLAGRRARACTNLLVSKGAAADGAPLLSYNADSTSLYGSLAHWPAKPPRAEPYPPREVWDWDGSFYLGAIPEANGTFNVVGNANEHGLVIGETTFGGLPELDGHGTDALIDYGSLIWITLQRARTAREAIKLMHWLVTEYGYASDGESFSVMDSEEVWLMELIGKGKERGAVWVASRVPDGFVGSTANQARTTTFARDDPENVMFAPDVVDFARRRGLFNGTEVDFDFSAVYDPLTFTGARFCEARVFNLFHLATAGGMDAHLDFAKGLNLTNRMPLFVKPYRPLTLNDTLTFMRNRAEGTWFDNSGTTRPDVGAGPGNSRYRHRPLVWSSNGKRYLNERTVGTQQTAWSFTAQSRGWMAPPLRALFWFAPDDSSTSVHVPFYGGATAIPRAFADPIGQLPGAGAPGPDADAYTLSLDSMYWVNNLVGQFVQGERAAEADYIVAREIVALQAKLFKLAEGTDTEAMRLWSSGDPVAAVELATRFGVEAGESTLVAWRDLWARLVSRFRDGATISPTTTPMCEPGQTKGCTFRRTPDVQGGYSPAWYARIVEDGDNRVHYEVPEGPAPGLRDGAAALELHKLARLDKQRRI